MLNMALISIRKDFKGNVLSEKILEILPDDPNKALADLGSILAKKIHQDPNFLRFCESYQRFRNSDKAKGKQNNHEAFLET